MTLRSPFVLLILIFFCGFRTLGLRGDCETNIQADGTGQNELNNYLEEEARERGAGIEMYINGLGLRNVGNVQTAGNSRTVSNVNTFEDRMQKAAESWKAITKAGEGSDSSGSGNSEDSCCNQCYINSQILNRMMAGSLFTQNGLSGMSLAGLSAYGIGSSALSAYRNPMGMFGSSIFSNIQI